MADDAAVKAALEEGKERREASFKEYQDRMKGKPTPTQEENDRAMLGEHVLEKEDDGSGPDPNDPLHASKTKQSEAHKPSSGGYQTRHATPQQPPRSRETS